MILASLILTSLVVAGGVLAAWDAVRRGLAAQVRQAELRVEGMQRADYGKLEERMSDMERSLETIGKAATLGRRGR